ncbi:sensor histidine kinase [Vibrio fluvialis]|uniref:ATP-binding protein n=1 Tax=Vibrio fluvialis TaxID=676 RepID=UPI0018EEE278|nr:ATP-binding protein [Vibrio fluvialis]EKO3388947.1 sensor histidine kinase [Vibrio fluvialis]ELI5719050.1 sensor histidine kinase [Vibrio fluvialis]MBY7848349.1 ATP-binding protein [Vibrio fluvialis]MBY8127886.1 ATP-binding protein [Vibrio fluvialis]
MKITRIIFPKVLESSKIQEIIAQLEAAQDSDAVEIDLNSIRFSRPTAMLVLGSKLSNWSEYRKYKRLKTRLVNPTDSPAYSYMAHVGFFDLIGSKKVSGKAMGEARGSTTYTPITKITRPSFSDVDSWYKNIISSVRQLANVLAGTPSDTEEHRFFLYTLRELVRNVFEHSGVDECYICGQRWEDGKVEISILDEGIGVAQSLAKSFSITNEEHALRQAIKPGVSSTTNISTDKNTYDNSGFGLYVLSEIAAAFGKLVIASNTKSLEISNGKQLITDLNFSGTFLGLELDCAPKQFTSLLKDIIAAGEAEARVYGNNPKASKLSKLI